MEPTARGAGGPGPRLDCAGAGLCYNGCRRLRPGRVPEWTNGAVSKTAVVIIGHRGFESLPFRLMSLLPARARGFFVFPDPVL